MTINSDEFEVTTLAPDDAFAVLGNETRMEILQTLGEADESLSFSELRNRVGMRDSGQFNYHLDQLIGHFLERSDDGYRLRQAGSRVIESVLSGAVTETPVLGPTRIDRSCHHCGAPVDVSYREEWVAISCTECAGTYGGSVTDDPAPREQLEQGYLGGLSLPPAGLQGRSPTEVVYAAQTWSGLETLGTASGVCPRCSASVDRSIRVCEVHDATVGLCEQCDYRHAVQLDTSCTNCLYTQEGAFTLRLAAHPDFLAFVITHGFNPISPTPDFYRMVTDYEEEIISTDPFKARFTYAIDDDTITLTVDDDLNVTDVTR